MAIKMTKCLCQNFEFGDFDGDNEDAISYNTNCGQSTTRKFAMGHDAKLVGYLVRAELAGEEIRMNLDGVVVYLDGAVAAAARISDALAAKAQAQLSAARARLAEKAVREARKAAQKAKSDERKLAETTEIEVPTHRLASIKVGRWTYDARIDSDGIATYSDKQGNMKTVASGKYTLV